MPLVKPTSITEVDTPGNTPRPPSIIPLTPVEAKDRRISRQGLYQAALQSVGVLQFGGRTFEEYLAQVRRVADEGLKYVNE